MKQYLPTILSGAGYRVLGAMDGKEAVQHVKISEVDLMITDLIMPEQEGLETSEILHRSRPEAGDRPKGRQGPSGGAHERREVREREEGVDGPVERVP